MVDPLVSTEWVADNLNDPTVRLVEVDVIPFKYHSAGHLKNAVSFNWVTDLQDECLRDLIAPVAFAHLLSSVGISNDDHVVLYGDQHNWFAAYGFWLFKLYGHAKVSLMDGGRRRWELDRRSCVFDLPSFSQSNYQVDFNALNPAIRADRQFILDRLGAPDMALLDVRSPDEYTGKVIAPAGMRVSPHRGGHIPGARNVPWSQATNSDGTYKSADELHALYAEAGITEDTQDVVAYCFIGERAAHTWFALTYILGYTQARNYDGSWTEWGNLVGVPIRQGITA